MRNTKNERTLVVVLGTDCFKGRLGTGGGAMVPAIIKSYSFTQSAENTLMRCMGRAHDELKVEVTSQSNTLKTASQENNRARVGPLLRPLPGTNSTLMCPVQRRKQNSTAWEI